MYIGIFVACPRILVDQSTFVTFRSTLGRNHILDTQASVNFAHVHRGGMQSTCGTLRGSHGW